MLYFFGKKNRLAYFQEKKLGYNAKKTTEKVAQHGLKDSKSCES